MPDIIVTRSDEPIEQSVLHKIALFCNVKPDCVIQNLTMPVLYQAPVMLEQNHFSDIVLRELHMDAPAADMSDWNAMLDRIAHRTRHVKVALVGKYVALHDAYLSVAEALSHAGYENGVYVDIDWIEAEDVTNDTAEAMLGGADAILVPGGFGNRVRRGQDRCRALCPRARHPIPWTVPGSAHTDYRAGARRARAGAMRTRPSSTPKARIR